jgi:hypothetical protein
MLKGDKIKYRDGIGCCIWQVMKNKDGSEDGGLCFDFSANEIDEMITLLQDLKTREPKEFDYTESDKWDQFQKERESKWWYRLKTKLDDLSIQFSPFCWKFGTLWVTKKVRAERKGKGELMYSVIDGINLGPLTITWWR